MSTHIVLSVGFGRLRTLQSREVFPPSSSGRWGAGLHPQLAAVAWSIFKTNVLRTLVLIVATMLFFVTAVICSHHEYTLPLIPMFVLGTPVVALVWLECFWQSVARIDRLPVPKLR